MELPELTRLRRRAYPHAPGSSAFIRVYPWTTPFAFDLRFRDVAGGDVGPFTEEVALHLLPQVLARLGIRARETVLVHQHLLVLGPGLPGFLRDLLVDLLAQLARVRREIEAFGLLLQLHALDHS